MRTKGTAHITNIMNDYDLLPVNNFKLGSHPDADKIHSDIYKEKFFTQGVPDGCWIGCNMSCAKGVDNYLIRSGPYAGEKVLVEGPEYETTSSLGSIMGIFNPDFTIESNFYCDTYGICTISWGTIMGFLMECFEAGVLFAQTEGIIPAPETCHAIRAAIIEATQDKNEPKTILFNFSGHGLLDLASYDKYFSGDLHDYDYPAEAIAEATKWR